MYMYYIGYIYIYRSPTNPRPPIPSTSIGRGGMTEGMTHGRMQWRRRKNLSLNHTLHPPPCTLHPTSYTLQPIPYILHPTPFTLHPNTIHPTPYTLNLQPSTPNPNGRGGMTEGMTHGRMQWRRRRRRRALRAGARSTSEQQGNKLVNFADVCLKAMVRIWP